MGPGSGDMRTNLCEQAARTGHSGIFRESRHPLFLAIGSTSCTDITGRPTRTNNIRSSLRGVPYLPVASAVSAMSAIRQDLEAKFRILSDEELLSQGSSGGLTDIAQLVAAAEAEARGLVLPPILSPTARDGSEDVYYGDLQIVARQLTATEAQMLCSCLQAGGVPAVAGDTNFVQTYSLLAGAVGGASVRVPAAFVPEALDVIAAFKRGEFQLKDDFDFDAES